MRLAVLSPVSGLVAPISEVPDPVFSQAMVGPGVAVTPGSGTDRAVAPVSGTVVKLHPHAFVISASHGRAVLVHLGIDTVELAGDGFVLHVTEGESVRAGQPVVTWNPAEVERRGYSSVCPVVALEADVEALGDVSADGPVRAGDPLFVLDG